MSEVSLWSLEWMMNDRVSWRDGNGIKNDKMIYRLLLVENLEPFSAFAKWELWQCLGKGRV